MAKTEVTAVSKFLTRYELPGGPSITVRKPSNKVRRLLVDNPDQQVRYLLDTIAAVSMTELVIPADYALDDALAAGKTFKFNPDDEKLDAKAYERFDVLDLLDMEAFSAAYKAENMPTNAMVENTLSKIKKTREAAAEQGKS